MPPEKSQKRSTRPELHLIDATFELFRAYFALPSMRAPGGEEVGAIRGLLGSTIALLREHRVTHVAAASDHVIESFRNDLFPGYKTGEGLPADLRAQFPLAEAALRHLGLMVWPMQRMEADDALATAARRFRDRVRRVVIHSPDKDLMQCVRGDHVVTHDRLRRRWYDEAAVIDKLGVPPTSIPDYLALVGDTADGIPGLAGWGARSASSVLRRYGHLDDIPLDPEHWEVPVRGAERLARTLREHTSAAHLFRTLATLREDAPISPHLGDLRWKGVPRARWENLCDRMGFGELRARPHLWAPSPTCISASE